MKINILAVLVFVFSLQNLVAFDGGQYHYALKYTIEHITNLDADGVKHNLDSIPDGLYKEDKEKLLKAIELMEEYIKTGTSYEAGNLKIELFFGLIGLTAYILNKRCDQLAEKYTGTGVIIGSIASIIAGTYLSFKLVDKIDDCHVKPRKMKELERIKQLVSDVGIYEN